MRSHRRAADVLGMPVGVVLAVRSIAACCKCDVRLCAWFLDGSDKYNTAAFSGTCICRRGADLTLRTHVHDSDPLGHLLKVLSRAGY